MTVLSNFLGYAMNFMSINKIPKIYLIWTKEQEMGETRTFIGHGKNIMSDSYLLILFSWLKNQNIFAVLFI